MLLLVLGLLRTSTTNIGQYKNTSDIDLIPSGKSFTFSTSILFGVFSFFLCLLLLFTIKKLIKRYNSSESKDMIRIIPDGNYNDREFQIQNEQDNIFTITDLRSQVQFYQYLETEYEGIEENIRRQEEIEGVDFSAKHLPLSCAQRNIDWDV